METLEINSLEMQVDRLLQTNEELKAENKHLTKKLANLARDRSALQEKSHSAAGKIKRIIGQLKEELL